MASGDIIEVAVVEEAIFAEIVEQFFDILVQEESYEISLSSEAIAVGLDSGNIVVFVNEEVIEVQVESWCNPCAENIAGPYSYPRHTIEDEEEITIQQNTQYIVYGLKLGDASVITLKNGAEIISL